MGLFNKEPAPTENNTVKSDFNEANFQILRLHDLSMKYASCWIGDADYFKARWILDQIWIELSADAQEEDKNKPEVETYFYKVAELDKNIDTVKKDTEIYRALQEKRIFLKLLQEQVGKGGKKSKQVRKVM